MNTKLGFIDVTSEPVDGGAIARVEICAEHKLNALDSALAGNLAEAFRGLNRDNALRAVVLTGGGSRSFVVGADIKEFSGLDEDGAEAFITSIHEACAAIRACPVPVVARIQGYCLGAGLEIAAACDLRAASTAATFGMPEVRVGVPSVIEAALLPRLIGWGRTNELLLTGNRIDAETALQWGLVERVAPPDGLDAEVAQWLASIVESAPRAIRLQKSLIRQWEQLPLDAAVQAGIAAFRDAYTTDEPRRYTARFRKKK